MGNQHFCFIQVLGLIIGEKLNMLARSVFHNIQNNIIVNKSISKRDKKLNKLPFHLHDK